MNQIVQNKSPELDGQNIPDLGEVKEKFGPLPSSAVLFGVDHNWFGNRERCYPVLYDVAMQSSPNVIVWGRMVGQGLKLVKTAIEYILRFKDQTRHRTEFVILSNNTKEWLKLSDHGLGVWDKDACIAVVPFWDKVADQLLDALAKWCFDDKHQANEPVILFIDGLENMDSMSRESRDHLKRVLSCGTLRNIYVIATADYDKRADLAGWFEYFQKEVFGRADIYWFDFDEAGQTCYFFCPKTQI